MSRQAEPVESIEPGKIGLYACGFTTYDYTHIGHLRKYSMDDVLVRALRAFGFEVTYVENVTDVGHLTSDGDTGEDKLEKGAKKYQKTVWEVAKEFEEYFWESMELMNVTKPDVICRATEHIAEQLEMVKTLEEKGFAYVIAEDGVYFDTSKIEDYGKLARLLLEDQQAGARVDVVAGKRNPTDFALWKFERAGENRAMVWPSPWAERSFPGWHIECSAMSMKYLGDQFDIHTGGIDHIPVHHTNEIAQAEATTGKEPFVKYWVHHNFLTVDGEKMSKSLGNFFTIDDVVDRGFAPMALRLLFLGTHYRSQMNFTWEALAGAQKAWEKLMKEVVAWKKAGQTAIQDSESEIWTAPLEAYKTRFYDHIWNDLATPEAVAVMWEVTKDAELDAAQKYAVLMDFDQILGLSLSELDENSLLGLSDAPLAIEELPDSVQELVQRRAVARQNKDWAAADQLRDELNQVGYQVKDTAAGQEVTSLHNEQK